MSAKLEPTTSPPSTSSVGASPARTSASLEVARAWLENARGSGSSSRASFARFDPASSSWRTSQLSLLEGSTEFSGTLPRSGSMRSGRLYERPTLVRPTDGKGSSWSRGEYPSLSSWARLWPTPTAGDEKASGAAGYSTASGRHAGTTLTDAAVRNWPTPSATDGKGSTKPGQRRRQLEDALHGLPVPTTCAHGGECRRMLNPRFVAWLMGFPLDWFETDDDD